MSAVPKMKFRNHSYYIHQCLKKYQSIVTVPHLNKKEVSWITLILMNSTWFFSQFINSPLHISQWVRNRCNSQICLLIIYYWFHLCVGTCDCIEEVNSQKRFIKHQFGAVLYVDQPLLLSGRSFPCHLQCTEKYTWILSLM